MVNIDNKYCCVLCQYKGSFIDLVPVKLYGKMSMNIYKCPSCSLAFVYPLPTREELEKIYSEDYFASESVFSGYADYNKSRRRNYGEGRIFGKRIRSEFEHRRILEVGCATGFFLEGLKSSVKADLYGIELSQWAALNAGKRTGITVKSGTLEESDFPDEYFDLIILRDIIEHTSDPVIFLKKCFTSLRNGGKLFIKIPNGRCNLQPFLNTNRKYNVPVNLSQAHLYYFENRTLKKIIKDCGFKINSFYAVGLKRGLRALGYIPKYKKKDSTLLNVEDKTKSITKHKEKIPGTDTAEKIETSQSSGFKSSDLYAEYKYFIKHKLKVPLSIGHNYILWVQKV
ncbi:class I SAM-dependent methyltransferase [candidate division KSB1 bacterium]